jgi:hypothetical protein
MRLLSLGCVDHRTAGQSAPVELGDQAGSADLGAASDWPAGGWGLAGAGDTGIANALSAPARPALTNRRSLGLLVGVFMLNMSTLLIGRRCATTSIASGLKGN